MWTDYALGALAVLWSMMLASRARRGRRASVALWAIAFAGIALAAIAAGTYHGFAGTLDARAIASLWIFVTWTLALASFVMLCAAVIALTSGAWRAGLLVAALLKLAVFAMWVAGRREYAFVLLDYGTAQLAILVLAAHAWQRERTASAPWLVAGVVVSALGGAVQQSDFALLETFNHNDLYHVIQVVGLFLFYRGGALFDGVTAHRANGEPRRASR
jgi:hypothetical protein